MKNRMVKYKKSRIKAWNVHQISNLHEQSKLTTKAFKNAYFILVVFTDSKAVSDAQADT